MLQQENKSYHKLFIDWLRLCFGNKGLEIISFVDGLSKMGRGKSKELFTLWHQLYKGMLPAYGRCRKPGSPACRGAGNSTKNDQCNERFGGTSH